MTDEMKFQRRLWTGVLSAALLLPAGGCRKKNRNPFLSTPDPTVTSATLTVWAVDNQQPPEVRVVLQVRGNGDINNRLTDFQIGNFSALEDGKPVIPTKVDVVGDPPFSVALVLDRSGSMSATLPSGLTRAEAANNAAVAFINSLNANDRASLVEFDSSINVTVPFTSDKSLVASSIANSDFGGGGTAIFDAVTEAARQLAFESGIKLLILLTDGDDTASNLSEQDAISALGSQPTAIGAYSIGLGGGIGNTGPIQRIAESTGGELFESTTGNDLDAIFAAIQDSDLFKDLVFVNFRQKTSQGKIKLFLNYGSVTASAEVQNLK